MTFKKPYYAKDEGTSLRDSSAMPEFMAYELFDQTIPDSPDAALLQQLGQRCATAWTADSLPTWRNRVYTALELLVQVPARDSAKLIEIMLATIETYFSPQKSSYFTIKDRQEKEDSEEADVRFPALFQEYANKLENVYRHLGTIFAFAKDSIFSNPQTVKPASWWLLQSAKTKLNKLDSPIIMGPLPINTLVKGYDSHFRNSIAHIRYKCLSRDLVEMWDVNEKNNETWRAKLSFDECKDRLKELSLTINVLEAAYFLFAMNNTVLLRDARIKIEVPPMSIEERHLLIYEVARGTYNLDVRDLKDDGTVLVIEAQIVKNFDIPQTSTVYVGGDNWAKSFDVAKTVASIELKRVAFGFIRTIRRYLGPIGNLTLSIKDDEGKDAGRIVVNQSQLDFILSANDAATSVDSIPTLENSILPLMVKFTRRGRPQRRVPKPPIILTPPKKKIIIP